MEEHGGSTGSHKRVVDCCELQLLKVVKVSVHAVFSGEVCCGYLDLHKNDKCSGRDF